MNLSRLLSPSAVKVLANPTSKKRLFQDLGEQAEAAGGAVHVLNGNHELMNAYLDYRYVTDGGWADFEGAAGEVPADSFLATLERRSPRGC